MCKHKSGGMSNPPPGTASQTALPPSSQDPAYNIPSREYSDSFDSDSEEEEAERSPMLDWNTDLPHKQEVLKEFYPHALYRQAFEPYDEGAAYLDKRRWFLGQKCRSADGEQDGYPVAGPSGLQRPSSVHWGDSSSLAAVLRGVAHEDAVICFDGRGVVDDGGEGGVAEEEFRSRSYSLTPTVHFAVFEQSESSSEEAAEEATPPKVLEDPFECVGKVIPISPSAAQLSLASSSCYSEGGSSAPICKICHTPARDADPLISPCRCSGTMQYIHCGCLMRWLEVCHRRGRRPASCELCQYQYHWHKKFKVGAWQLPPCSRRDKILHFLFFLSVLLMVTCASLTVLCFKQDGRGGARVGGAEKGAELSRSEVVTLVCGVLFFLAFFVAMYVEVKSRDTLYQLMVKFIHINQQWYIDEYEKNPVPV